MKIEYKEIFKLKVMLDNANISYEFFDRSLINYDIHSLEKPFFQIIVYDPRWINRDFRLISVIEGFGTFGNEVDSLEIQGCLTPKELKEDSVLGHLTAEEVFRRIKENYEEELEKK